MESTIYGISVRAILALTVTVLGFAFIYAVTFFKDGWNVVSIALTAVIGFINLALGYYLGQKGASSGGSSPETPTE